MAQLKLHRQPDARQIAELHRHLASAYVALGRAQEIGAPGRRPLLLAAGCDALRGTQMQLWKMLAGLERDLRRAVGPDAPLCDCDTPDAWHRWLDAHAGAAAAEREGSPA